MRAHRNVDCCARTLYSGETLLGISDMMLDTCQSSSVGRAGAS